MSRWPRPDQNRCLRCCRLQHVTLSHFNEPMGTPGPGVSQTILITPRDRTRHGPNPPRDSLASPGDPHGELKNVKTYDKSKRDTKLTAQDLYAFVGILANTYVTENKDTQTNGQASMITSEQCTLRGSPRHVHKLQNPCVKEADANASAVADHPHGQQEEGHTRSQHQTALFI